MQPNDPISDIKSIAKEMQTKSTENKKWMSTQAFVMKKINDMAEQKVLTPEEFRIVKLERKSAQLPLKIGEHRRNLTQTLADVVYNMKLLKESKNKTATEMHKNYDQSVKDTQQLATNLIEARTKLEENITTFVAEKTERIKEIKEAMKQGKPLSMIKGMIDQTEKKETEFKNKFTELENQEDKVQQTLNTLRRETNNTLIVTGAAVRPEALEPTPTRSKPISGS